MVEGRARGLSLKGEEGIVRRKQGGGTFKEVTGAYLDHSIIT